MASMLEPGSSTSNIYLPEEWSEAADSIAYDSVTSPPPLSLICGAKNSGKTTLSRHLLNVLLQRYVKVAYLDTDVGQPEFTVPGFVSLTVVDKITPDLAIPCLKTPERCFYFGDVSSKRNPTSYLKYICALYDYYREQYRFDESESAGRTELPLVVNTPGWVKGIGYEILVDMLRYFSYSCDQVCSPGLLNRSVLVQKDARLLRDLRIIAYFRQCFPSDMPITTIKELAYALASHSPYEVPISIIKIRHLHCQVPSTETYYSLNATIVGLAVSSEESEDLPWCVGLGIVRGIDTLKGVLYVITPVLPSTLEKVNLFLQGFIQIPTCLLQVTGCRSPYVTSNVLSDRFY
ncbi:Polynucleotide 5'-hydroxyl-kinase NOL9 [Hibiscus syriacus]|uniref:Polynucleotide 5'-hydroxyl-kinase NOL9 n=1 Tax=Hibiscus syriacus TaxID=106335 RepID=A0A6A2X6A1_HIBSY|nr:Polynucleotide 5'-hydroxyl-kinase NOL9 [Hibiscus syriacus]